MLASPVFFEVRASFGIVNKMRILEGSVAVIDQVVPALGQRAYPTVIR